MTDLEEQPLLEARNVSISFGGVRALDDASLSVPPKGIVGLIGPNGAGKTTLFNCLSGLARPKQGAILFQGSDVTGLAPHRRALLGMGRTFQNVGLCKGETVLTNLKIAQHREISYSALRGMFGIGISATERGLASQADELLQLLDLKQHRHDIVRDLPVGSAKLVELACVLSADPMLLLLDEPSSGLGPDESDRMREVLIRVQESRGLSILLIGHDMRLVMTTAQFIYVLDLGKVIAAGEPNEIRENRRVIAAYLGSEAPEVRVESGKAD